MRPRTIVNTVSLLLTASAIGAGLTVGALQMQDGQQGTIHERAALACARASDGADQSIADCYYAHGLECPEDICFEPAPHPDDYCTAGEDC